MHQLQEALGLGYLSLYPELEHALCALASPSKVCSLGIYGGSFNPPHKAHVELARQLSAQGCLDYVLVVPALRSPFKEFDALPDAQKRFELCLRAFADIPRVFVSEIELRRNNISYTFDTLKEISAALPCEVNLKLILGSDAFESFDSWKCPDGIRRLAQLLVIKRNAGRKYFEAQEYTASQRNLNLAIVKQLDSDKETQWCLLDLPHISSTELRLVLAKRDDGESRGKDILHRYLPAVVLEYIQEHKLYLNT